LNVFNKRVNEQVRLYVTLLTYFWTPFSKTIYRFSLCWKS
jgi:hypothetical protein